MVTSLIPPPRLTGRDKLLHEGLFELKAEAGRGLCLVRGCRQKHIDVKRGGNLCLCAKHYMRRWRWANPKQAAYAALKSRAKSRGIPFLLDFQYFKGLCDAYGYFQHQADNFAEHLSLDRVDARLPYQEGNVRVITVSENSAKSHREKFLDPVVRKHLQKRRDELQGNLAFIEQNFREWDPESDEMPF